MGIQFNLGDDAFFGLGRIFPDAVIDLDFRNGLYYWGSPTTLSAVVTCVRSGNAGLVPNANGTYGTTTANTPRVGSGTGLWEESPETNYILNNADLTQVSWVKVGATISAPLPAPVVGGAAGQQVLATTPSATVSQALVLTSATRILSACFYQAAAGDITGAIMLSEDGGVTETDVSSQLIVGQWVQISVAASQSVLNPTIRLRIANSGDKIGFALAQIGDQAFTTTPIVTTSSTSTRSSDRITLNIGSFPALVTGDQLTVLTTVFPRRLGGWTALDISNPGGTNQQTLDANIQSMQNDIGITIVPPGAGIDPASQFWIPNAWNVEGYSTKASTKTGICALRGNTQTNTFASWPNPTTYATVQIGGLVAGGSPLNGAMGRLIILPTAWTAPQLAAWTSQAYP